MASTIAPRFAPPGGLSVDGLSFSYPPGEGTPALSVLAGASFHVPEGTAGVILGGADRGKTTLARILAGLVPRFTGGKLAGRATFGRLDLLATRPYDAMDSVGLVFQDPDEQLLSTRCDSEVAFGLESLGVARAEMEPRITGALGLMGMEAMRARNPGTLSGGEKKRLLLSCLLALDPALWILDEVFQELDVAWREVLLDHLRGNRRTALFLDSRWSSLYESSCAARGVLSRRGVLAAEAQGTGGRLAEEGLVLPVLPFAGSAGAGAEPFLKAEGVELRFPGPPEFRLSIESLTLEKGAITAIVGRNGSGKSTLGKMLCGLHSPDAGTISLRSGSSYQPATARLLQRRVGYLFQNPDYQVFLPTIAEELAFGLRTLRLGPAEVRARVQEAIALFRLPEARTPPALMSYGARRRLQAATYHLLVRDILILDEIDSGLGYSDFLEVLPALRAGGRGVVLVTHDLALARYVAGRVLVMDGGRIVEDLVERGFPSLERAAGAGSRS